MPEKIHKAYGSWPSPISAQALTRGSRRFGHLASDGAAVYWLESRPEEGGRGVIVRYVPGQAPTDLTPADFSVRSRVYEYGGGDFWVHAGTVVFANDSDQRLYRQRAGGLPEALTPAPPTPRAWRYADGSFTADGEAFVCVRERHETDGAVINEIVWLSLVTRKTQVLVFGSDFYAFPRLAVDGRLAWVSWNHPNMPWDASELWQGQVSENGELHEVRRVGAHAAESVAYPAYAPDGRLFFVSDRCGYYCLYAEDPDHILEHLTPVHADFAPSYWGLGYASYAFDANGSLVAHCVAEGQGRLLFIDPQTDVIRPIDLPFTSFGGALVCLGRRAWFTASGPRQGEALIELELETGQWRSVRAGGELALVPGTLSEAQALRFPGAGGREAHAFFYRPQHADFTGLSGESPPLIVMSHGGPTGATNSGYNPQIQFWTSRGFAVVDVNYTGSTGYGRAYREALQGQWGLADVEDCVRAARYLVARGEADGQRLIIRGGSAGGFTTLCALTFYDDFAAGMSRYGVADLEALARDSHKFEAHYLDSLVAPYPEQAAVYRQRSPIHHAERLSCPLLVLQGEDDAVVPPAQSEALVRALKAKRLPHAYLLFPGEGHGFRRAETQQRALEAELYFYRRVFGLTEEEGLPELVIENLS